jgi:hypothetical protein
MKIKVFSQMNMASATNTEMMEMEMKMKIAMRTIRILVSLVEMKALIITVI